VRLWLITILVAVITFGLLVDFVFGVPVTLSVIIMILIEGTALGLIVGLVIRGVRGFARGFRRGLRGDAQQDFPSLRSVLFRTVLVTLLVLTVLWMALLEYNQRDQRWPVSEGMLELRNAQSRGAPWLDAEAQAAIESALKDAVGGNPAGGGEVSLRMPIMVRDIPLPASEVAALRHRGWVVGTARAHGDEQHYVAWKTSSKRAVFYFWVTPPWYWELLPYPFLVLFTAALLSPFAAIAAWHLNRRIVKPVQQVADASVVLAEGSSPQPIPEKGPAELATMARSFNRLADRLDEAEAAQKEFVASVNHELKTPLTSLQGYGELLSDGAVSAEEAGPVVLAETARLQRLVGDLMEAGRLDSGTFAVREQTVPLDDVAAAVQSRFAATAESFGISLEAGHEPAGEASVLADADRLVQVVSNLTENALRCTPAGGSVRIVVAPPALIRVVDTGPGLAEEDLPHAFDRFYLYERCGKDRPVGTGLGLSIVKELTEAMHGTVSVESEVGVGTVFEVELPPACGASPAETTPDGVADGA
jgi:signal transduction histidine kinase